MKKLLLAVLIVIGLGIGYYFLYQYNYNEAKDAMSLDMPKLVYALPTFETLENKKFNELIEKYIPQEHRNLTENLTESQRNVLSDILAVGGDSLIVENIPDNLKEYW